MAKPAKKAGNKKAAVAKKQPEAEESPKISAATEKKGFPYYWSIIDTPVYLIILWVILKLIVKVYGPDWMIITLGWVGWVVIVAIFSYIGFKVVEKEKGTVRTAAKAGAIAGAIYGLADAVGRLIIFYNFPQVVNEGIQKVIESDTTHQLTVEIMTKSTEIMSYVLLVIEPLLLALICAGIAALTAWFVIKKIF